MNSIKSYLMSFAIALVLIQLSLVIYGGFQENYGFTRDTGQTTNLFERLISMNIVSGPLQLANSIMKLFQFSFNPLDIIGSLFSAGIGVLKTLGGIVTLPAEIIGAVTDFYYVPGIVATFIGSSILISIAILIVQLYIKPFQPM